MQLFASRTKKSGRRKLRVLGFWSVDWGFTDASLPKLHAMVSRFEDAGADVEVLPSSLSVRFFGEKNDGAYASAKQALADAQRDPDFKGFLIGTSEGYTEHEFDVMRVSCEAFKNAQDG